MENSSQEKVAVPDADLLPVSLLCGFLGAGKTTLMKHILETKHEEKDFRCAIIVNDMAALNIDKSLIDQSALVQSDEVIAMQNGCFCCTLQSDLVDQIISLTEKKLFNYMLIEASGVSEPSQIAPLFDLCDDEHDPDDPDADHEHVEGKPQLGEVARLDTCITVVDSAEFYSNLASMKTYEQGETVGTIAELMMEQVEFSNVVVVNKGDLVNKKQKKDIISKIELLNPNAKIVESVQSKVNVMDILNTHMFKAEDNKTEFWMKASKDAAELVEADALECCMKSVAQDGKKCCKSKSKDGKLINSGLSQVELGVAANNNPKDRKMTRHEERFGITSFIYQARRPFHPGRLPDLFLEPYFSEVVEEDDEDKMSEEEKLAVLEKLQKEAAAKQLKRTETMGQLLRSKGFLWIATSHDVIGGWQQAGNVMSIQAESPWMCETREMWEDTPSAEQILKDMKQPNGEEWKYQDRRQGLVFIGQGLKHEAIQKILDKCLLTDKEMEMGPDEWWEAFADDDKIQLTLDNEEEGEEEEEGENNEDEGEEDDTEESEPPAKKKK